MKQVRFDTPRRSDSRLHPQDDSGNGNRSESQQSRKLDSMHPTYCVTLPPVNPLTSRSCSPVQNYELRDPRPHPVVHKTALPSREKIKAAPTLELELSELEVSDAQFINEQRKYNTDCRDRDSLASSRRVSNPLRKDTKDKENGELPNVLNANSLLLKHHSINKFDSEDSSTDRRFNKFEVTPNAFARGAALANYNHLKTKVQAPNIARTETNKTNSRRCNCYECTIKFNKENNFAVQHRMQQVPLQCNHINQNMHQDVLEPSLYTPYYHNTIHTSPSVPHMFCRNSHNETNYAVVKKSTKSTDCSEIIPVVPSNDVSEKFTQTNENNIIEKQTATAKREPTVADLFKIIQMQNDQLKLLQNQVDKLLLSSQNMANAQFHPVQNFVQERVALETVDENHHKISIGVMTSFEVIKTNKERNSQIQCNRSQVSIKEVISEQNCKINFLDGIASVSQQNSEKEKVMQDESSAALHIQTDENVNEEKTFNDMSLCNLQLDNSRTPQMSPDQSLYLDVKDYSDSENEDRSGVGWTYYNKVMSHVNEILQESELPSSAEALHRRAVEAAGADARVGPGPGPDRYARVHADVTDLSITKRVTFDEHALYETPNRRLHAVTSDTSIQINRLAAKYLRRGAIATPRHARRGDAPLEMSLATRKYMEHHNLLRDGVMTPPTAVPNKILDITALKQQPKLL